MSILNASPCAKQGRHGEEKRKSIDSSPSVVYLTGVTVIYPGQDENQKLFFLNTYFVPGACHLPLERQMSSQSAYALMPSNKQAVWDGGLLALGLEIPLLDGQALLSPCPLLESAQLCVWNLAIQFERT